jgi:hypothetical protein
LTRPFGTLQLGRDNSRTFEPCRLSCAKRRTGMFNVNDLFQWEKFITPSIIKIFYWLAVAVTVLFGLSTMVSGLGIMIANPLAGLILIFSGLASVLMGVIFARIISELILIVFRINEHLGAIRERGDM